MKKKHLIIAGLLAAAMVTVGCAKQPDSIPTVILPESSVEETVSAGAVL